VLQINCARLPLTSPPLSRVSNLEHICPNFAIFLKKHKFIAKIIFVLTKLAGGLFILITIIKSQNAAKRRIIALKAIDAKKEGTK